MEANYTESDLKQEPLRREHVNPIFLPGPGGRPPRATHPLHVTNQWQEMIGENEEVREPDEEEGDEEDRSDEGEDGSGEEDDQEEEEDERTGGLEELEYECSSEESDTD